MYHLPRCPPFFPHGCVCSCTPACEAVLETWCWCAGQEERQVGALSSQVVWKYIAGTGGVLWLTVLLFLYCSEQGSKIITDRWPGLWTQDQFDRGLDDLGFYLGIYAALAVLFGLVTLARSLHFTFGAVRPPPPPSLPPPTDFPHRLPLPATSTCIL